MLVEAKKIIEEILDKTEGGLSVFQNYLDLPSNLKKPFKMRAERTPSSYIKFKTDRYWVKDFGTNERAFDCFSFIMKNNNLNFYQACKQIVQGLNLDIQFSVENENYEYIQPNLDITDKLLQYFKSRGISPSTVFNNDISLQKQISQKTSKEYYVFRMAVKNLKNQLLGYKSRVLFENSGKFIDHTIVDGKPKKAMMFSWLVEEKEQVKGLFGLENVSIDEKEIIICEGEMDMLTYFEVQKNLENPIAVVSPMTGVNALNWLDICADRLAQFKTIYIAFDDEATSEKARQEVMRRLGKYRCKIVKYHGLKDANKCLTELGPEKTLETLAIAEYLNLDGLVTVNDVWDDFMNLFDNGRPEGYKIEGWDDFNNIFRYHKNQFLITTGIPQHGKSSFVAQMEMKMAVQHGWKWAIFSPESGQFMDLKAQFAELYFGKAFPNNQNREGFNIISRKEILEVQDFFNEHFFWIDPRKKTKEELFERMKAAVLRHGVTGCRIDPYNKVQRKGKYMDLETLNDFLNECCSFKKEYDLHLNLVAHPQKMSKTREEKDPNTDKKVYLDAVPTAYDIFGGSEFFNQADVIMVVYRNMLNGLSEIYIKKAKTKEFGKIGVEYFTINIHNGRYTPIFTDDKGEFRKGNESTEKEIIRFQNNKEITYDDVPF